MGWGGDGGFLGTSLLPGPRDYLKAIEQDNQCPSLTYTHTQTNTRHTHTHACTHARMTKLSNPGPRFKPSMPRPHCSPPPPSAGWSLTFSAWMGLVTLNLSMVDIIMEGVVRKNSTTNREKLMPRHWSHHRTPWMERFFLRRATPAERVNLSDTDLLQQQRCLWLRHGRSTVGRPD